MPTPITVPATSAQAGPSVPGRPRRRGGHRGHHRHP